MSNGQKVITLDSTILNTISLCEQRAKYSSIDNIEPQIKGEALERGSLMHMLLEIHEGIRCNCVNLNSETWRTIQDLAIQPESEESIAAFSARAGRKLSTKLDLSSDEIEQVLFQFSEYIDYYRDDVWETLAVEEVGSKILFEDENLKIIYTFKIDKLAKRDQIVAPWDYKTSKKRTDLSSLSNQFFGYCWATDSNYIVIDKIGFQKTLSREERFQRILLSYDSERIEEWRKNAIRWSLRYARLLQLPEEVEMNLTSCDKYSGCIFKPICEASPSARPWIITRDFKVGEKWDPARILEPIQ